MCDRFFLIPAILKIHIRNHTGEKPFHCSQCEKKFKTTGKMESHQKKFISQHLKLDQETWLVPDPIG